MKAGSVCGTGEDSDMKFGFGWKSWVFMGVAVALAGVALGQILAEAPEPENALPVGPAAPDFALDSPDGSVMRLSDNKDQIGRAHV